METRYQEYRATGLTDKITFAEFLRIIGFADPSVGRDGMDDGYLARSVVGGGPLLFTIPEVQVQGRLRVIVLLADFSDRPGARPPEDYAHLLFSQGIYPTGSMADYFTEVSGGRVQVEGTVHGWLRLPKPYSSYVNNESGMGRDGDPNASYPNNAQAMAEDTVAAALAAGVPFPKELDALDQGLVTALFIVHAGPGAEVQQDPVVAKRHIWSHKWNLRNPIMVAPNLEASVYLTVPENCRLGVCAHELGHLAFQWDDFYDANYNRDGHYWDGSGMWDLMAAGSYNGSSLRPAHPAGLHKMQHGWVDVIELGPSASPHTVTLRPFSADGGSIVRVRSNAFAQQQYLILENRQRSGFDEPLPGPGLLVWRVDENLINTTRARAGLFLVQADAKNNLDNPNDYNAGDDGDPFPGALGVHALGDTGDISTTFPNGARSGITLSDIKRHPDGTVTLTVTVAP